MLKWLIKRKIAAFERQYDYDMSYARMLLDADVGAATAFARVQALSEYRKGVPSAVGYAVSLVAVMAEDCGPCTQLVATMAERDGMDLGALKAVLRGDDAALSDELRLGVAFARACLAHDPTADRLRAEVRKRWGERGLITLAFAIVTSRIYPTLKYALGAGKTCERVLVAGEAVATAQPALIGAHA